jgi:tetratricopeptide (TPR) repeat protein
MLFELVTGRPLFEADAVTAILAMQVEAPRPDPREVAPDRAIPDALAELCLRAVALDPAERFADADAFADALSAAVTAPSGVSSNAPSSEASSGRPMMRSAPQIRSPLPGARYSLTARAETASGEFACPENGALNLQVLQQLQHDAHLAMTKRRWNDAITALGRGLELAASLLESGQTELGAAALRSISRRLGEALRREGRFLEAIDVLRRALVHARQTDLSRALLLEELGLNAAAANLLGDAIGAWLDAAEAAGACGNGAVERRLLRRIEDFER